MRDKCSVDGCPRTVHGLGLCNAHWQRQRNGLPLDSPIKTSRPMRPADMPLLEWIALNVIAEPIPNHPDPCHIWTGQKDKDGYGSISVNASKQRVHRVVWEQINGPVPDGLVLDHEACDRPACCQPSHLVPKTDRENILRGRSLGATNARKTHCKHGHPLSGENLILKPREGGRVERKCLECRRTDDRIRKAAQRGAA